MKLKKFIDALYEQGEKNNTTIEWWDLQIQQEIDKILKEYDINVEWMKTPCAKVRGLDFEIEAKTFKTYGIIDDAVKNIYGVLQECFHPYAFQKLKVIKDNDKTEFVYLIRFGNSTQMM